MKDEIKISFIDYSFYTRSVDIFTIGCSANPRCKGCCNPELWDWKQPGLSAKEVITKVDGYIKEYGHVFDRFLLVGGDPVDGFIYTQGLDTIIKNIREKTEKPIFLFTHHSLDEVPQELKEMVDYIKCGPYIPELVCEDNWQYGIKLATSNQKIYSKDKGEF